MSVARDTEAVGFDTEAVAHDSLTVASETMTVALEIMSVAFPTEAVAPDTKTVANDSLNESTPFFPETNYSESKGKHPLHIFISKLLKSKQNEKEVLFTA